MPRVRRVAHESPPVDEKLYYKESLDNEMVNLAYEAARKQMLEGTASAQVITHFLKLGTVREELELEKIRRETDLLETKKKAIESAERMEQIYAEAIKAMSIYNGQYETEEGDILDEFIDPNLY